MRVEASTERILERLTVFEHESFVEVREWPATTGSRAKARRQASLAQLPAGLHHGRLSIRTIDWMEKNGYLVRDRSLEETVLSHPLQGIRRRALRITTFGLACASLSRAKRAGAGLIGGKEAKPEDEAVAAADRLAEDMLNAGVYETLREAAYMASSLELDERSEYSKSASALREALEKAISALTGPDARADVEGREVVGVAKNLAAEHEATLRRLAE